MILALQTNTFGCHGGIPAYNRLVCRVLNNFGSDDRNHVLIAMDSSQEVVRAAASHPNLRLAAFDGQRLSFAKTALGIAAREPVELVLAGHVNYAPLCVLLKRLRPRMRFGVVVYGCEVWERIPPIRRWALQQADFLISISGYTKQLAVDVNKLRDQRVYLLPNALEWETDKDSSDAYSLPQGTKLLSVGRLDTTERRKGFDTIIESLPFIAQSVPDIQYLVIGSGSDLERHRQLAMMTGVSDRVHFLGAVDEALLRTCYQSSEIFVMPSAQEGFGFVYLEAMQYRKPIVAATSGGAPEVVQDGVTGKLVEYGNREQLAQTIIDLCLDPNMRQRLGEAGYQRLNEKFTFSQFQQKLTDILLRESPPKACKVPHTDESASCAS